MSEGDEHQPGLPREMYEIQPIDEAHLRVNSCARAARAREHLEGGARRRGRPGEYESQTAELLATRSELADSAYPGAIA
jgi:hypothetical protein